MACVTLICECGNAIYPSMAWRGMRVECPRCGAVMFLEYDEEGLDHDEGFEPEE